MSYQKRINKLKAEKKQLEKQLAKKNSEIDEVVEENEAAEEARIILTTAAQMTQRNLELHFSDLVSKALACVFERPYTFKPEFVERRNQTECDLWLVKEKNKLRPTFAVGGGALDVISFALRLSFWRLSKTHSVFILDEPFKFLSKGLMPKAIEMLKMLSQEFELQIIMVSHITELANAADKTFKVEQGKLFL